MMDLHFCCMLFINKVFSRLKLGENWCSAHAHPVGVSAGS